MCCNNKAKHGTWHAAILQEDWNCADELDIVHFHINVQMKWSDFKELLKNHDNDLDNEWVLVTFST